MESNLKNLIISNYKEAFKEINEIVSGKGINCFVLKPNQYLTPSIITKEVPLNDKDGEFFHYNQICETLEKLLAGEKVEYTCHFRDAPINIKNLLIPIYIEG
jgi:hypothetical protein